MKKEFLIALLVFIIVLSSCTSQTTEQSSQTSSANLDSFAQCLTEKGVNYHEFHLRAQLVASRAGTWPNQRN